VNVEGFLSVFYTLCKQSAFGT